MGGTVEGAAGVGAGNNIIGKVVGGRERTVAV